MGFLMSDTMPIEEPLLDPEGALVDIRTLARVALQSDDLAIVQKDLEIILAIVDKALRPATPEINPPERGLAKAGKSELVRLPKIRSAYSLHHRTAFGSYR
jgi:hypothetical protein